MIVASAGASPVPEGEILFTGEPPVAGEPENIVPGETFGLLDDLYLRVNLEKPLSETYDLLNIIYDHQDPSLEFNYALRFYVDGQERATWLFEMPAGDFRNALEFFYPLSTSDNELIRSFSYTVNNWKDLIAPLEEGSHKVEVEFIPLNRINLDTDVPVLARGGINLQVDRSKIEVFREKLTGLPEPTIINESLQEEIVSASERIFPRQIPIEAIITDVEADWSYSIDDLGNITRRYIIATVVYRNSLNDVCSVRSGVYYQEYKGYGIFGETFYLKPATGYFDYAVPCDTETGD